MIFNWTTKLESRGNLKMLGQFNLGLILFFQNRSTYRRNEDLEKTKYSLVANSSNFSERKPLRELVSSGNKLAIRFFSKLGKLPGRGFKAKFKIGKNSFETNPKIS